MKFLATLLLFCASAYGQISCTFNMQAGAVRVLNTVYQNTTGKLMKVDVSAVGSLSDITTNILVGASNPPGTTVATHNATSGTAVAGSVTVVVPPGYFYKATASSSHTVTLELWSECTIDYITTATQSAGTCTFGSNVQNNTSDLWWIELVYSPTGAGGPDTTVTVQSDSSATPTTAVLKDANANGQAGSLIFPVIGGNYYNISNDNGATIVQCTKVDSSQPIGITQNVVTSSRNTGNNSTYPSYQSAGVGTLVLASFFAPHAFATSNVLALTDMANPAITQDIDRSKNLDEVASLLSAIPNQFFYAEISNTSVVPTLALWVEYVIPQIGVGSTVGEKRRRRPM